MKKVVVIVLIMLLIVTGGLLTSRRTPGIVVDAPVITTSSPQPAETPSPETGTGRTRGPEQKTLAIGGTTEINGITVTLRSLEEDSRCPQQVVCIHAGSVSVQATVSDGTVHATRVFSTNAAPFLFEGYAIKILSVTPQRITTSDIQASDYRITFEVSPTATGDNI